MTGCDALSSKSSAVYVTGTTLADLAMQATVSYSVSFVQTDLNYKTSLFSLKSHLFQYPVLKKKLFLNFNVSFIG